MPESEVSKYEMPESPNEGPLLYTLRQLHEDTAAIMEAVNTQDKAAIITNHGRFIAVIQPLGNYKNLEGSILSEMVLSGELGFDRPVERVYTAEEILAAIDNVDLSDYRR